MSVRFFGGLLAAAVMASLGGVAAAAQTVELRAAIPFPFTVDGMTLPPGLYHVKADGTVLFVRGPHGGATTMMSARVSSSPTAVSLVFAKYGDEYALRQIWMGDGIERQLLRPPAAEAGRRAGAAGRPTPSPVAIPAL
jgi:hypothetical protein